VAAFCGTFYQENNAAFDRF